MDDIHSTKNADYEKNELSNEALEKQVSRPAHVDAAGRPVIAKEEVAGASTTRALNFRSIYAMVVFGCSSFMFGYDNGIIGSLVSLPDFVRKYQGPELNADGLLAFTARNQNLLFSVPLVGSIFGAILSTPLQNYCGRKWGLVYACEQTWTQEKYEYQLILVNRRCLLHRWCPTPALRSQPGCFCHWSILECSVLWCCYCHRPSSSWRHRPSCHPRCCCSG